MARAPRIAALVRDLQSTDGGSKYAALEKIRKLDNGRLKTADRVALVAAAGLSYPGDEDATRAGLLWAAATRPNLAQLPEIERVLPGLHGEARQAGQALLAELDDPGAARLLIASIDEDLARPQPDAGTAGLEIDPFTAVFTRLQHAPKQGSMYFPALAERVERGLDRASVLLTALDFANAGKLPDATTQSLGSLALAAWTDADRHLGPAQGDRSVDWWEGTYAEHRETGAISLDLLGHIRGPLPHAALEKALAYRDTRLVAFAALASIRRGEAVQGEILERVAASAETRWALWKGLKDQGREDVFPARFRTQAAFAEARMVDWLVYPTELGRPPDRIELMKVVTSERRETGGPFDTYVFRFRSNHPSFREKGWMAGVAGPFRRADAPTADDLGGTFSKFEKWESQSAEEHAEGIDELLDSWWAEHGKREGNRAE